MNLFQFPQAEVLAYLVVLVRIAAMVAWFPIFGDKNTPLMVKILFSFLITLIVFPIVKSSLPVPLANEPLALIILIVQETTIGLLVGLVARMVFYTVGLAAQVISFQMGFGMVSVIDPTTSERISIVNQFQISVATLLFFALNIHHMFFEALIVSYGQVAPGMFSIKEGFLPEILRITSVIFTVGFKIAAPVAVVLLITNSGLGVLSRAVPQMNVFMVSFPITIGVGLIILGLSVPLFVHLLGNEFELIGDNVFKILKTI
jgi:flagellar biosynthesis protein FliR